MRSAWSLSAALRRTTPSNADAVSSIIAHSSPEPAGSGRAISLRLGAEAVGETERVGQAAGRVDRHDDGTQAAAGRLQPDHGGGRRLADASGAAAHDDLGALEHVIEHERHVIRHSDAGEHGDVAGVEPGDGHHRQVPLLEGELLAESLDLGVLHGAPGAPEVRRQR